MLICLMCMYSILSVDLEIHTHAGTICSCSVFTDPDYLYVHIIYMKLCAKLT